MGDTDVPPQHPHHTPTCHSAPSWQMCLISARPGSSTHGPCHLRAGGRSPAPLLRPGVSEADPLRPPKPRGASRCREPLSFTPSRSLSSLGESPPIPPGVRRSAPHCRVLWPAWGVLGAIRLGSSALSRSWVVGVPGPGGAGPQQMGELRAGAELGQPGK